MANDDVNLNRPTPSPVQGTPPVSDTSTPPPSPGKAPRVDAGDGRTSGDGQGTSGGGPILDLPKMMPTTALTMMLFSIQEKVTAERISSAKDEIKDETKKAQDADKKRIDDINKMREAQKKAKHHSKLGKILGWVGVALTFVAAVVVTVASGGAAAAPVFAAAVLMTGLMIAQETGGMHKLAGAMGLGKKGEMGLMIGLTAAVLVVSLVPIVMSGGAAAVGAVTSLVSMISEATATGAEVGAGAAEMTAAGAEAGSAAAEISADSTEAAADAAEISTQAEQETSFTVEAGSEAADSSSEVSESSEQATQASEEASQSTSETSNAGKSASESEQGSDIAEKSATRTQKVAARVGNVVNLASGGTTVGGGATGIQAAEDEHDVAMAQADSTDQQATLATIQALQAATLRKLRKILEEMQSNAKTVLSIMSTSDQLAEEIAKSSSA